MTGDPSRETRMLSGFISFVFVRCLKTPLCNFVRPNPDIRFEPK